MSDRLSTPEAGGDHPVAPNNSQSPVYLHSEPDHFFSNRFRTSAVRDKSPDDTSRRDENWGLLLMITTVGVPILAYCVFAAM